MFCGLYFPPPVWCTNGGAYKHAIMLAPSQCLGGTNVGHGPVRTLFLGLILYLVPMTPCDTIFYCMLYWPHPSALVAYGGGTNVGHGPVRTLFWGLILYLVPMTPCYTQG